MFYFHFHADGYEAVFQQYKLLIHQYSTKEEVEIIHTLVLCSLRAVDTVKIPVIICFRVTVA
jgi:hypothetical protein